MPLSIFYYTVAMRPNSLSAVLNEFILHGKIIQSGYS